MHPKAESGDEYARAVARQERTLSDEWALAQAEVRAEMWAQVWTEVPRSQEAEVEGQVWAWPQVEGREKWAQRPALTEAEVLALAQVEAQTEVLERARVLANSGWMTEAKAQAEVWAGPGGALVRALDKAGAEISLLSLRLMPRYPSHQYGPTYEEVIADMKIKSILDSIKPIHRRGLARALWRHSDHFWLIQIITPVTRLPPELLYSIFSIIIDDDASGPPLTLMLVCKHWYTIVTGIWASLKLGTRTPRDTVARRNQCLLDIVVDTEIDRGHFTPSVAAYGGIFAAIEATSRWRSLLVRTSPGETDLPEHQVNHGLQRCSNASMSRLKSFRIKSVCEMSPLVDRLLCILGSTASVELSTLEINSPNIISFLVHTYSPIFRSIKVLFLDISGPHDPVDLLPHLHQLETLTASHLSLPIYADDINLPCVNTLRHLTLRAVSIQWMSGRTFDVLQSCIISFPLNPHILHPFSTTIPNCKHLTFQGYPLDILDGVSAPKLNHLSVTSSGSFNRRGDRQLVWFSSRVLGESRLAPRILHISIGATSQAWMNALTFMPHLEELLIENTHPSSLGVKVFQSLFAQPGHTDHRHAISATGKWRAPLCPLLKRLGLKYRRWLRTSEHFDLIPTFMTIIWSRKCSNCALQSFRVWAGDPEDSLELVEKSQFSIKGVERLASRSGIEKENVWGLVFMRWKQVTFKPLGQAFDPSS